MLNLGILQTALRSLSAYNRIATAVREIGDTKSNALLNLDAELLTALFSDAHAPDLSRTSVSDTESLKTPCITLRRFVEGGLVEVDQHRALRHLAECQQYAATLPDNVEHAELVASSLPRIRQGLILRYHWTENPVVANADLYRVGDRYTHIFRGRSPLQNVPLLHRGPVALELVAPCLITEQQLSELHETAVAKFQGTSSDVVPVLFVTGSSVAPTVAGQDGSRGLAATACVASSAARATSHNSPAERRCIVHLAPLFSKTSRPSYSPLHLTFQYSQMLSAGGVSGHSSSRDGSASVATDGTSGRAQVANPSAQPVYWLCGTGCIVSPESSSGRYSDSTTGSLTALPSAETFANLVRAQTPLVRRLWRFTMILCSCGWEDLDNNESTVAEFGIPQARLASDQVSVAREADSSSSVNLEAPRSWQCTVRASCSSFRLELDLARPGYTSSRVVSSSTASESNDHSRALSSSLQSGLRLTVHVAEDGYISVRGAPLPVDASGSEIPGGSISDIAETVETALRAVLSVPLALSSALPE